MSEQRFHHLVQEILEDTIHQEENPSVFGFHHGPIPNLNVEWNGYRQFFSGALNKSNDIFDVRKFRDALETKVLNKSYLSLGQTKAHSGPKVHISKLNGGVCWLATSSEEMCGARFESQNDLRTHFRKEHLGSVHEVGIPEMRERSALTAPELEKGKYAIKWLIIHGGWRLAKFKHEPGVGGTLIKGYCDLLEMIAAQDLGFANTWGAKFHRDSVHKAKPSSTSLVVTTTSTPGRLTH